MSDDCNSSLKSRDETVTLAAKCPDDRRAWVQLLKQVLYKDTGGGQSCSHYNLLLSRTLDCHYYAVVRHRRYSKKRTTNNAVSLIRSRHNVMLSAVV